LKENRHKNKLLCPSGCCAACHAFCVPPSVATAVPGIFSSLEKERQLKIPSLPVFLLTCGSLRAAGKLPTPPAGWLPLCKNIAASGLLVPHIPKLAPPLLHSQAAREGHHTEPAVLAEGSFS